MMEWPEFNEHGNLPSGIHPATLKDVLAQFGRSSLARAIIARRLERIYRLAAGTGSVARFIVFGSFVTAKEEPNDVDVFMLMEDNFDVDGLTGEARIVFEPLKAQNYEGASVFWLRRSAVFGGEQSAIETWQRTRERTMRGIVEIVSDDSE